MTPRPILAVIFAAAALLAIPQYAPAAALTGSARVTDGDTIKIRGTRIRLNGIDAPETDQVCLDRNGADYRCGIAARSALGKLIANRPVSCTGDQVDRYHRRIMTCIVGGTDINAAMVKNGWALAFRRYSTIYVPQEQAARQKQTGLWSGAFIAPWDWRHRGPQTEILGAFSVPIDAHQHLLPALPASASSVTDCRIKGNISRSGARIYHVPGMVDYNKTRISESEGERWFCSEEEAQKAGWRRAQR
ncbi:thermonuclease family protein [Aquamicrobium soli]|uniref:Thermonuclease family protein n=1 Tax=Aquamicrobium soli TaxID=1811518 RepID=A0ABV7K862_9HYPH